MNDEHSYGRLWLAIARMIFRGTTGADIADLLEVELDRFPEHAHTMRRYIAEYRGEQPDTYNEGRLAL